MFQVLIYYLIQGRFYSTHSILSPIPQDHVSQRFQACELAKRNAQHSSSNGRDKKAQTNILINMFIFIYLF